MTELNYVGAISAYSHGIKLSPKMAILYLNRSKAHVQVKNYHKAIEDSTTVSFVTLSHNIIMYVRITNNILTRYLRENHDQPSADDYRFYTSSQFIL